MTEKKPHGGSRPGAGRKTEEKKTVQARLTPAEWAEIKEKRKKTKPPKTA